MEDLVCAGPIAVSAQVACTAWLEGRRLDLGVRQVRLLAALLEAGGRLVTRDELYQVATGRRMPMRSRAIDMDVWRLRQALGAYGAYVRSVRKVGYAVDVAALERVLHGRDTLETRIFHGGDRSVTGR